MQRLYRLFYSRFALINLIPNQPICRSIFSRWHLICHNLKTFPVVNRLFIDCLRPNGSPKSWENSRTAVRAPPAAMRKQINFNLSCLNSDKSRPRTFLPHHVDKLFLLRQLKPTNWFRCLATRSLILINRSKTNFW